jgi:CHAD domain-containing protein
MAFRFRRSESVPAAFLRVAHEQIAALAALLREKGGRSLSDERMHETRTRLKRLRSLLRLVREDLGEEAFRAANACFRHVGEQLAPTRSAAVNAATFDALLARHEALASDESLMPIRVKLTAIARHSRSGNLTRAARNALAGELEGTAARLDRAIFSRAGWDAIADGLRRTYKRGRKACAACVEAPETVALHTWRKRVKDLWHQLALLGRLPHNHLAKMIHQADRLSKALGDDHDLAMLAEVIDSAPNGLREAIATRRERLQKKAFHLGERLYAKRPRRFLEQLRKSWEEWRG